eukprot:gene9197-19068_t
MRSLGLVLVAHCKMLSISASQLPRRVSLPFKRDSSKRGIFSSNVGKNVNVRVITDIDDTVKSSGGVKLLGVPLGGIDTHYKRGEFYPGAFQFAFELSSNGSRLKQSLPAKIAVLTARAKEFKFALALKPGDKISSAYEITGKSNGFPNWGIGDVYYGSVAEWIFQGRKGQRKFNNFEILLKDDQMKGRSEDYVMIGDTGEKDEEAGERIAKKYPDRIKAIFLHSVSSKKDRSQLKLPEDRIYNGVPIIYFRTYVGAAFKAAELGLLAPSAITRVIDQARMDLSRKELAGPNLSAIERGKISTRWQELEEDINLSNMKQKRKNLLAMFDFMRAS